jgi:hypothetical protein
MFNFPPLMGGIKGGWIPLPNPLPQADKSFTARRGERELYRIVTDDALHINLCLSIIIIIISNLSQRF